MPREGLFFEFSYCVSDPQQNSIIIICDPFITVLPSDWDIWFMMKLVFTHCSALEPLQVCCVLAVFLSMIDDYAFCLNFCRKYHIFLQYRSFSLRLINLSSGSRMLHFCCRIFPLLLVNLEYSCNGVVRVFLQRRCSSLNMCISVVGIIARSLYFPLSWFIGNRLIFKLINYSSV